MQLWDGAAPGRCSIFVSEWVDEVVLTETASWEADDLVVFTSQLGDPSIESNAPGP